MKGWTPEGAEVELTERQEMEVRALVTSDREQGGGWSTVLHTALRIDNLQRGVAVDDPAYDALAAAGNREDRPAILDQIRDRAARLRDPAYQEQIKAAFNARRPAAT